jgi:site-specific recombinase XerD
MSISWEQKENSRTTTITKTQQFSADPILNDKIKTAVVGLQRFVQNYFLEFPTERDKELVADFIIMCIQKENVAIATKKTYLNALIYLSRYFKGQKSFEAITSLDLSNYLISFQKNMEEDPDQGWISTHRSFGMTYLKFFKWLAYPGLTPQERKRLSREKYPPVLKGFVLQTKKGTKSPVTAKDIWDDKDVAIFLKYCTDNPRHRFYHALAYETSARPGELLQLKIEDIEIQLDENGAPCALIDVGRYGKRKQSRIVGITKFTIQYYQAYLQSSDHPDPTNRKSYIFVSRENSAHAKNLPITVDALRADYLNFRDKKIPKLLKRPDIPSEDKEHLQFLKDTKKWYPYIIRHSSLTKLAPNIKEYRLREHAGWAKNSNMIEVYTHTLTGDSAEDILMLYGVNLKNGKRKRNEQLKQELVGPTCPFCHTINVPDSQFCISCRRPIAVVSYDSTVKKEIEEMKARQSAIEAVVRNFIATEMDLDPRKHKDRKKIDETFQRVLDPKSGFWGD